MISRKIHEEKMTFWITPAQFAIGFPRRCIPACNAFSNPPT